MYSSLSALFCRKHVSLIAVKLPLEVSNFLNPIIVFRLVDKINNSIGQDPNSKTIIGVLDIYGFESFKINR